MTARRLIEELRRIQNRSVTVKLEAVWVAFNRALHWYPVRVIRRTAVRFGVRVPPHR